MEMDMLYKAVLHKDSLHKQEYFMYRDRSVAGL